MQFPNFLEHLKETASSPFAFVAYVSVVAAWVYVVTARHRLNMMGKIIKDLPEAQRKEVIMREYSTSPRAGLSSEQWLKTRKQTLLFISFLASLVAIIAIVGMTVAKTRNKGDEIPDLVDPVEVPLPSPTPTTDAKRKQPGAAQNNRLLRVPLLDVAVPNRRFNALLDLDGNNISSPSFRRHSIAQSSQKKDSHHARLRSKSYLEPRLELVRILEDRCYPSENVRIFDVILANKSKQQKLLKAFQVRWSYEFGGGANIEAPHILRPSAKYVVEMPIDVLHPKDEKYQPLYPILVTPPGTESEPNLVSIRLHMTYRIDRHPATNWDLIFTLAIVDSEGESVTIFQNMRWKDRPQRRCEPPKDGV